MTAPSAAIVARAVVLAARKFGSDPLAVMTAERGARAPRVLAAVALEKAGFGSRTVLQHACAVRNQIYFSPSQWDEMHFTAADVDAIATELRGAQP